MKNIEILEMLTFYQRQIDKVTSKRILDYYKKKFNGLLKNLNRYSIKYDYETPQDVINLMIKDFEAPKDFATITCKKREYVIPRQQAIALSYHIFSDWSLRQLAAYFGNKNHATILHSKKTVKNICETDKKYRAEFEKMQKYFLGSVEI